MDPSSLRQDVGAYLPGAPRLSTDRDCRLLGGITILIPTGNAESPGTSEHYVILTVDDFKTPSCLCTAGARASCMGHSKVAS